MSMRGGTEPRIRLIKITTWWRKYSIIRKSMLIIAFLFVKQNSQSLRCLKIRVCLLLSWKQRNDFITMLSSLQTEKILVIITTTLHSLAFNWRSWFKTKLTTCRVERIWVLSADHCHQQHVSHLKNIWWCSLQKILQKNLLTRVAFQVSRQFYRRAELFCIILQVQSIKVKSIQI